MSQFPNHHLNTTLQKTLLVLWTVSSLIVCFFFVIHSTGAAVTSGSQHNSTSSLSSVSTDPALPSSETESSLETLLSSSSTGPVGCCSWPSSRPSRLCDVPPSVFRLTRFFSVRGKSQSKVESLKGTLTSFYTKPALPWLLLFLWGGTRLVSDWK